jgi:hypothetical protein
MVIRSFPTDQGHLPHPSIKKPRQSSVICRGLFLLLMEVLCEYSAQEQVNRRIRTEQKFICVNRPRRFGKSMTVDMLTAYYSCDEETLLLFENLKIASADSYREHLNQYDVIKQGCGRRHFGYIIMIRAVSFLENGSDHLFFSLEGCLSKATH